MVRETDISRTTRLKLISLLPRLRRFAAVLAGDRPRSDEVLRAACMRMLEADARRRGSSPFDIWAFSELHALWLEKLRGHIDPMAQGRGDELLFRSAFSGAEAGTADDGRTAEILSRLPPQQRSALLLIYGDGFSYEDAALILDAPRLTVVERAARALSTLIDATGPAREAAGDGAVVESLYPAERQAG